MSSYDDQPVPAAAVAQRGTSQWRSTVTDSSNSRHEHVHPEEEAGDDNQSGPVAPCPSCGRTFNATALAKHARVCEKVFMRKRREFNTVQARLGGTEAAKFFDAKQGAPKVCASV
jgi:hypothetical protein